MGWPGTLSKRRGEGCDASVSRGEEPFLCRWKQENRCDTVPVVPTEQRHPLPSGWNQKNRRWYSCRIDPDDCREPNGRDGHPCQGGRESYKQKTIRHGGYEPC